MNTRHWLRWIGLAVIAIGLGMALQSAARAQHAGGHPAGHPGGGARGGGTWHGAPAWRGGGGREWWGLGLGLGLGIGLADPYLYYPYGDYYYPDGTPMLEIAPPGPILVPQNPPTRVAPAAYWYYCPSAKAYYPYVRVCPESWQTVPAMPPPPAR